MSMENVDEVLRDARTVVNITHFRDGHIPTDRDVETIWQKNIDLYILEHKLVEQIATLQKNLDAVREQVALHRSSVSCYRRVPPEILSEIFVLALPNDWLKRWTKLGTRQRVLNFAGVCTTWRTVALTMTPQLWTTFSLDDRTFRAMQRHPWAMEMELARTGQAPLDLHIYMSPFRSSGSRAGNSDDFWHDKNWGLLCAQSHRWRQLSINAAPLSAYNELVGRGFPLLTHLSTSFSGRQWAADTTIPLHVFEAAKEISNLSIEYDCTIRNLEIPRTWRITSLDIQCTTESEGSMLESCLDAIIACRDTLQSCTLSGNNDLASANAELRPTQFPHLRTLTLFHHAILLCPCFAAPSLDSLRLYMRIYDRLDPYGALTSLLDRSESCKSLRSLWLDGLPPSPNQDRITRILRRLPYLKDLELSNNEDIEDFESAFVQPELLHTMTRDPHMPNSLFFLPMLKRLALRTQCADADYDEYPAYRQATRDLLASRRRTYRAAMPRSVIEAIRDARTIADLAHLRDGFIPSDKEAEAIELKAEQLQKIDLELAEQSASLQADRNAIQSQIAVHRALILLEIFTLALPDDWEKRQTMLGTRQRVLDFAGVCTSWRTVAHTMMPRLWTDLRINDMTFRGMKRHPWAMESPLDLHIWMHSSWDSEDADDFWHDKAWEVLCAQSHRWRRLTVGGAPLSAYNGLAGREFPLLTHLSSRPAVTLPMRVFESATQVTDLHIDYNFTIGVLELPPAWAITTLNIDCSGDGGCSLEPCLEAVKACSQTLESCLEPEPFPRLRTLSLFYFAVLLCPCFAVPNDLDPYEPLSLISLGLYGLPPPTEFDNDLELMNNEFIEEFNDATVRPESMSFLPALTRLYDSDANLLDSRKDALHIGNVNLAPLRYLCSDVGWILSLPIATYKGGEKVNTIRPRCVRSHSYPVKQWPDHQPALASSVVVMPRSVAEAIRDARTVADISLLRDGHIPSDLEAAAIARKADDLKKIELELAEQIASLQADQEAIRRQVAVHRALVSPYRRVPPEILSEIFILALPDDWEENKLLIGTRARVLGYAQVCFSWRAVALALTPQLWTALRFNMGTLYAMEQLAKTGQAPLDVHICIWLHSNPSIASSTTEYWNKGPWSVLRSQSHRWRRLSLVDAPLSTYNDLVGCTFQRLTELAVGFWRDQWDPNTHLPLHVFENAPNVTHSCIAYNLAIQRLRLPRTWKITSLEITCYDRRGATLAPCIEAIMACNASDDCRSLKSLELNSLPPQPSFDSISRLLLRLPHLEELDLLNDETTVEFEDVPVDVRLLRDLTRDYFRPASISLLPKLARLRVTTRVREDSDEYEHHAYHIASKNLLLSRRHAEDMYHIQQAPLQRMYTDVGVSLGSVGAVEVERSACSYTT
ncbi:hypothetical protein EV121DRAFT_279075 [Schizophyllum commune]